MTAKQTTAQLRDRIGAEQIAAAVDSSQAAIAKVPDAEDQRLFAVFRTAYQAEAVKPELDSAFDRDIDLAVNLCDMAGIRAVRAAIANGNPGVSLPPVDGSGM